MVLKWRNARPAAPLRRDGGGTGVRMRGRAVDRPLSPNGDEGNCNTVGICKNSAFDSMTDLEIWLLFRPIKQLLFNDFS